MSKPSKQKYLFELLMIAFGCALYAFSLDTVSVPNRLADGGLSGISLILNHFWNINMGLSTLILNIPLLFLGYHFLGKRLLIYTIWGTICLSFFLWLWHLLPIITQLNLEHDLFLSAITAGTLSGLGLGLVFRYGGTSGGTDIIARIVQMKLGISSGKVILTCDAAVLIASLSYLDLKHMMYTLLASYILSKLMDRVQEGAYSAKGLLIISSKNDQIQQMVEEKLERGLTYLKGRGGYSQEEKRVIYLVVSKRELVLVKNLILEVDPKAFISIFDVHEALGEGFSYARKAHSIFTF